MIKILDFSNGGFLKIESADDNTFAIDLGHRTGGAYRLVRITDVEVSDIAITLANLPGVKEIIAKAVDLDRLNRPEAYK
jgi:hypothetical protein